MLHQMSDDVTDLTPQFTVNVLKSSNPKRVIVDQLDSYGLFQVGSTK
jgi:hypothetical protein